MTQDNTHTFPSVGRTMSQRVGLMTGPLICIMMLVLGKDQTLMGVEAWHTAAIGLWMAVWWATEAVPVPVTAFLPIIGFAPLGIAPMKEAVAPYAHPIIFLYLGGFIMALAVERWGLHQRIAIAILLRIGTNARALIGGFMFTAAILSMWMTNTSTTMMLLPIAISIVGVICENIKGLTKEAQANFKTAMLLGLAYAATIGGMATLIGTPPNALLIGFLQDTYDMIISFSQWMLVGVPLTAIMLPVAWLLLTRFIFPVSIVAGKEVTDHFCDLQRNLGPMSVAEKRVAILFCAVILLWMGRRFLVDATGIDGLSDTLIVMAAATLLFVLPSGDDKEPHLMTWEGVKSLPWGVLILFGGGLSLAAAVSSSGLAAYLGGTLAPLSLFGTITLIIAAVTLVIFLTEMTSNLATTATFLPVMGAIGIEAGIDPLMLCLPVTLAASCAFMLPVATPPNAIVFASGFLKIPQMIRAGFLLNLIGIALVVLVSRWWAPYVWGL